MSEPKTIACRDLELQALIDALRMYGPSRLGNHDIYRLLMAKLEAAQPDWRKFPENPVEHPTEPEEELYCDVCGSQHTGVIDYDFGFDGATGYHDTGEALKCLDCGAVEVLPIVEGGKIFAHAKAEAAKKPAASAASAGQEAA